MFKLLFSSAILIVGAIGGIVFVVRPWFQTRRFGQVIESTRPWRPLGAAIGFVVAVMFVLGIYLVDIPDHPRAYAAYWAVMLLLQFWLCLLALKDIRYTRRRLATMPTMDKWASSLTSDSIDGN